MIVSLRIVICAGVMLLSGCSAMSDKQCLSADWQQVGRLDAEQGRVAEVRLEKYLKSCADVGVIPSQELYEQGYQMGLVAFCTQKSGYYFGLEGHRYRGTCMAPAESAFLSGYEPGIDRFRIEKRISDLERQIAKVQSKFMWVHPHPIKQGEDYIDEGLSSIDYFQTLFWLRMELQDALQDLRAWKQTNQQLIDTLRSSE